MEEDSLLGGLVVLSISILSSFDGDAVVAVDVVAVVVVVVAVVVATVVVVVAACVVVAAVVVAAVVAGVTELDSSVDTEF